MKNNKLIKAKTIKDDEFYTRLVDIENEVSHYREYFYGKVVYCNCDNPKWSGFFQYFKENFKSLGLKKLISTHYSKNIINDKIYKLEYFLDNNGLPKEIKTYLDGDGDFRSKECVIILKESDIVCTNPPFSLFREYISQLIEYDKKFLIIGNINAISYKETFSLIKENKLWLGVSPRIREFYRNIEKTELKSINAYWFTNITHKKINNKIILYKKYNSELYTNYDNFNAIEVSKTKNIPFDYDGVIGVPITFLEKYNPEQFEIIGITKKWFNDILLRSKIYTKEDSIKYQNLNSVPVLKNGDTYKILYVRILIQKKL